jgi:hypothetical protein
MSWLPSKDAMELAHAMQSRDVPQPRPEKMYVALFDYEASGDEDMSFGEQDHLEILDGTRVWKKEYSDKRFRSNLVFSRKIGGMLVT